jgi:rhodanese-related sulfurtransferase
MTTAAGSVTRDASSEEVRRALREADEIGLLDVRPEAIFAQGHPLFAASLPLDRLELEALERIPSRGAPLAVYGSDPAEAHRAVARLIALGYRNVRALDGGLHGWIESGGEVFEDVNAPSKAFGELVAERLQTPAIDPLALRRLLDDGAAVTVLDARRLDEYRTMSIPTAASAPGATLVREAFDLPGDDGLIVVNCAGRTRSIIGAQTLINAGARQRVVALRNGTIGWTLAGLSLETGQDHQAVGALGESAVRAARRLADRAGVARIDDSALADRLETGRTVYRFDVRSPPEYEAGHLPSFRSAPGGQLIQETDRYAPVRGAQLVLADDGGTEADVTASWLAQMGWQVAVLDGVRAGSGSARGPDAPPAPALPAIEWWGAPQVAAAVSAGRAAVLDVGRHADYRRGHLPGALWASRAALLSGAGGGRAHLPIAETYVLTSREPALIAFAALDLDGRLPGRVVGLDGGTEAWTDAGRTLDAGDGTCLSPPLDRYRRPYEGTDVDPDAMRAYLEWEYGLVAQLQRDATHRFSPLTLT